MGNFLKRINCLCLCLLFLLGQAGFPVFASSGITLSLGIFNKIDVALAVGQTSMGLDTFEKDLKAALSKKSPAISDKALKVIMGSSSVSSTSTDEFKWWKYDHTANTAQISDADRS